MSDNRDRQLSARSFAPLARALLVATPLILLITAGMNFLEVGSKDQRALVGAILAGLVSLAVFVYSIAAVIREDRNRDA